MFEQILQLRDRYEKMVLRVTLDDMKVWSADFFSQHPFITEVAWHQYMKEEGRTIILCPQIRVTPGFATAHPDIGYTTSVYVSNYWTGDELYLLHTMVSDATIKSVKELRSAVDALKKLFNADDILTHVFHTDKFIKMTPGEIIVDDSDMGW